MKNTWTLQERNLMDVNQHKKIKTSTAILIAAKAAIENINQRFKSYVILGSVYRGLVDDFHKITKII